MCRPEFENGGLRERPVTENGGLSERRLTEKRGGILELKIIKKRLFLKGGILEQPRSEKWKQMYIFEKGVFRSGPGRKRGVFRSGPGRKMVGFRAAHTSTALIWE